MPNVREIEKVRKGEREKGRRVEIVTLFYV